MAGKLKNSGNAQLLCIVGEPESVLEVTLEELDVDCADGLVMVSK